MPARTRSTPSRLCAKSPPRPEGSQGPGRRRSQAPEGEHLQGRRGCHRQEVRRRRDRRNQVSSASCGSCGKIDGFQPRRLDLRSTRRLRVGFQIGRGLRPRRFSPVWHFACILCKTRILPIGEPPLPWCAGRQTAFPDTRRLWFSYTVISGPSRLRGLRGRPPCVLAADTHGDTGTVAAAKP